jgi:cytoskeletal protein RodZ
MALGDVSNATNISIHVLEALERGEMARVPGGLFARAFLRAYARHVGLDAERIVRAYVAEHEPVPEDELQPLRARYAARPLSRSGWLRPTLLAVLGLCLIIYTAYVFASTSDRSPDEAPMHMAPAKSDPGERTPLPVPVVRRPVTEAHAREARTESGGLVLPRRFQLSSGSARDAVAA